MAQEQAIRKYRDSLVKGLGEHKTRSAKVLPAKARTAINAVKTRLQIEFEGMLAIADPENGENFILEILM